MDVIGVQIIKNKTILRTIRNQAFVVNTWFFRS